MARSVRQKVGAWTGAGGRAGGPIPAPPLPESRNWTAPSLPESKNWTESTETYEAKRSASKNWTESTGTYEAKRSAST